MRVQNRYLFTLYKNIPQQLGDRCRHQAVSAPPHCEKTCLVTTFVTTMYDARVVAIYVHIYITVWCTAQHST